MAIPIRPGVYKQDFDNSITMSVGGLGGIGVPARFEKGEIGVATEVSDRETLERLFGKSIKEFNDEDYAYIDNMFYYTGNIVVSRVEDTEFNYSKGNYTIPCENAQGIIYSNGGSAYCNNMFNINAIMKSLSTTGSDRANEWKEYEESLDINESKPSTPDFSIMIKNSNEDFEEIYTNSVEAKSRLLHSGILTPKDNSFNSNPINDGSLMIANFDTDEPIVCKVFNRRKVAHILSDYPDKWEHGSIVYRVNRTVNDNYQYPLIANDALIPSSSAGVIKIGYCHEDGETKRIVFDKFDTTFKLSNDYNCYIALTPEQLAEGEGVDENDKAFDAIIKLFSTSNDSDSDNSAKYVLGKFENNTIDNTSEFIFIPKEAEVSDGEDNYKFEVMFDYVFLNKENEKSLDDVNVKFVCYNTYTILSDNLTFKTVTNDTDEKPATEFCRVVARTTGKWADNKNIQVMVCPMANIDGYSMFDEFAAQYFNFNPNLNDDSAEGHKYATDQIAVVVFVDGSALEKYIVSVNPNAKTADGLSNYWNDVINNSSQYIYFAINSDFVDSDAHTVKLDMLDDTYSPEIVNVMGGNSSYLLKPIVPSDNVAYSVNSNSVQAVKTALKAFADRDSVQLEYLCDGAFAGNAQVKDALVDLAVNTRCGDCVVVVGPRAGEFQGVRYSEDGYKRLKDYIPWVNNSAENQYVAFYANTKQVYDSQNDSLVWISCSSDAVGLNARVDRLQERWYAVAGTRRGILTNTIKLGWYPNDNARESMTKDRLNPIIYDRGNGNMIYDTMSLCGLNSDLSEFYNRKTLNYLQVNTENYMKNVLFEINDQTTRSQIVEAITPFYRSVYNRRGLAAPALIQADEKNNPPSVVTQGLLYVDIMIQFNRAIKRVVCRYRVTPQGATMTSVSEE